MNTPEFLKQAVEEGLQQTELARLQRLVEEYQTCDNNVKMLEAKLKMAKESFNVIAQQEIPSILNQYGLSDIRLASGEKITVKEELSVSVKEDKLVDFYKFLKDRGDEDIVKLLFQFRRMPESQMRDLFAFLNEHEYDFEYEKVYIHRQ